MLLACVSAATVFRGCALHAYVVESLQNPSCVLCTDLSNPVEYAQSARGAWPSGDAAGGSAGEGKGAKTPQVKSRSLFCLLCSPSVPPIFDLLTYTSLSLSIYLSIYRSIDRSIFLSRYARVYVSIYQIER